MLFSILIAQYNNGHFFEDCYNSIITQTWRNWEVVIVDDGSTDNSVALIRKLIASDPRFRLYENDRNRGCGYTKRRCAALAKGEILGFLDPDDFLTEDALKSMVDVFIEKKQVAIVTSKYRKVSSQKVFLGEGTHGESIPIGFSYLTYGKGAMTHFASFRNSLYKRSLGIDSKMNRAVDQDLYLKLEEQGEHHFLNKILYNYRIHDKNISLDENKHKARYWHFYAINKAYKRRKTENFLAPNFSEIEIAKLRSDYFIDRYRKAGVDKNLKAKYFFFFKAIFMYFSYKGKSFHL